jgi:alkylation response protein AidB-like acyl-CoA dehydrogenase
MDFELSDDQVALQEGVRNFCQGRFPIDAVRALEESGGVDRGSWRELADMGIFSLRLAEADGGVGLGWADTVLAFEELGRALVPGPLVWTQLAAGVVDGAATGEVVVGGVERSDPWGVLDHLDALDVLLVVDEDGVAAVDPAAVSSRPIESPLDPLTPVSILTDVLPAGERLLDADAVPSFRLQGAALTAGLLLGISGAATDLAVAYSKDRVQFDRPIGTFQALKHLMADMLVRTEVARGAVYAAGVTLDDPVVGSVARAVAASKITAADAAVENAKTSIQVHGGMGYTWEIDAHLHLKRAYALEPLFGTRDEWSEHLADLLDAALP